VSVDLKAVVDHISVIGRKQYVFPFALAPLWLHLELIRPKVAVLAVGVILMA
jgi:hypothetical protein